MNASTTSRPTLLDRYGDELERRLDEARSRLGDEGAGASCAAIGHALEGAALTLGLDGLAVAAAAFEAACDEAGGDTAAAARALGLARDELRRARDDPRRIAHDLRGALGIVVGYASLLETDTSVAGPEEAAREILIAAERMAAAVDRLDGGHRPIPLPTAPRASARLAASILVVEDDPVVGALLAGLLEGSGASAVVVTDGREALRCLADIVPDLVILDLELGDTGVGGRDVLRAIRTTPALAALPVVVASGEGSARVAAELEAAGATAVLPKPVDPGALAVLLDRHRRDG